MIFHLPKLREYVRSCFNQTRVVDGFLSLTDLDFSINEAYMSRSIDLMMAQEGYFEDTFLISLVAGQEAYALPSNFIADQKEFIKTTTVERLIGNQYVPLAFKKRYDEATLSSGASTGDNYLPNYKFRGRNIVFEPTPDSSQTDAVRMTFAAQPTRLQSANAQAGSIATTIVMSVDADERDDYYNGTRIIISSGIGVGQIRIISDYVGLTKVATVSAWTTIPTVNSTYSTLINSDFPELYHELLALDACISGYLRERSTDAIISNFVTVRQKRLEDKFKALIEDRTDYPKFTRPWHLELS